MKYTWIEIDLNCIAKNYRNIRNMIPEETDIIAVVKADAYGLGSVPIAKKLEREGCRHFAVTFIEEAIDLRKSGICGEILVMMPIECEEVEVAAKYSLTTTMSDLFHAKKVSDTLLRKNLQLSMHVKIDCGLSRMGIVTGGRFCQAVQEIKTLARLPGFRIEGIFTHITAAGSTEQGKEIDQKELKEFKNITDELEKEGFYLKKHCLSSDPLMNYREFQGDYIRIGTLLYGVNPEKYSKYRVENCMSLKSKVVQVKTVPADTPVSYGPIYTTQRETKIAVVAVGFADGLRRALSNKGKMLLHGQEVPIIGKICCDHTMLDVTDIEKVEEGDIVTLFGKDQDMIQHVGKYASLCNASEPEITSIFSARVPRVYLNPADK